jgi:hypothetical protein
MHWIGPITQPTYADALENGIELGLAHEKSVVLDRNRFRGILEVERHAVVECHRPERAEARGRVAAQDFAEPRCGCFRITCRNDGVIEVNGHMFVLFLQSEPSPPQSPAPTPL